MCEKLLRKSDILCEDEGRWSAFSFKGDLRPKLHPCFYDIVSLILWRKSLDKVLIRNQEVIKLWRLEFSVSDVYPKMHRTLSFLVFFAFFVRFAEKKAPIKFFDILLHFSGTYEVAKFWVVKLYLDVSDVIHANEHTKNANCDLPVNFWIFLLKSFCFMMKKNHFKQKLLFWS